MNIINFHFKQKIKIQNSSQYLPFSKLAQSFHMSNQQFRLSLDSSSSLGPFNNYDSKQKQSWLCYLCGGNTVVDEGMPTIQRKQKITLSRMTKTVKPYNSKATKDQVLFESEKIDDTNRYRLSLKSPGQINFPKPTYQQKSSKFLRMSKKSYTTNQNPQMVKSAVESFKSQYPQCNVIQTNKLSYLKGNQSGLVEQPFSQHFIQPIRNMQKSNFQHARLSYNMKTTDSSSVFINSIPRVNSQQKLIIPLAEAQKHYSQYASQHQPLYRKLSQKDSQILKLDLQNPPQSNHLTDIKHVDSVEETVIQRMKSKKKSISPIKSMTSKLHSAVKKVNFRCQELPQDDQQNDQIMYSNLGNKIKIGIRKVQSFDSSQDEDQYSQVLSHGERSFLMTEINEVTEMSRISERSPFKLWQDQVRNPQK